MTDIDGAAYAAKVLRGVVTRLGHIEVIAALETLVAALDTAHAHLERLGPHARDPGSVAVVVDLTETVPGAIPIEAEPRQEVERLRAALDKIAERTGSDDPCRALVQIARDALAGRTEPGPLVSGPPPLTRAAGWPVRLRRKP